MQQKKLKVKIARKVTEMEIQHKKDQKINIQKQIRAIKVKLKSTLTLIYYDNFMQQINNAIESRVKATTT